jgi:hypothetical protein
LDFQAFYHCHPPLSTEKCGHERPLIPVGKAANALEGVTDRFIPA